MRRSHIALGFALALVAPVIGAAPAAAVSTTDPGQTYEGTVTKIWDGDSIRVSGIAQEVRLIGVDAAERGECYYSQSKGFAEDELVGEPVTLRVDRLNDESDHRLFAYVYVDGEHYNLESVSQGYARERAYGPDYELRSEFEAAQQQAEQEHRGLWDACS